MRYLRTAALMALLFGSPAKAHVTPHCLDRVDVALDAVRDLLHAMQTEAEHFWLMDASPDTGSVRAQYLDARSALNRAVGAYVEAEGDVLDCLVNR